MSVREAMKSPVGRGDGSEGLGALQDDRRPLQATGIMRVVIPVWWALWVASSGFMAWTIWQIGQTVGW